MTPPLLGLVVPVYDESARFADYGKALVDYAATRPGGVDLVFVDDGSTDGTHAAVDDLLTANPTAPARLLRRPHTGKGGAVAAGLAALSTPYAGFCDVDLSTPLDQLDRIVEVALRGEVLAIGSRDLAGSRLLEAEGSVREGLGRLYNRLLQATVTPGVVDTQCGAKVASRQVWEAVLPRCREVGFAWDAEVVAVARALGIAVQEVAVDWRHDRRSKVRVGRDGLAMVRATPRIWRSARQAAASASIRPAGAPVFDDANAATLAGADATHWWFRSKAAFVATALRRSGGVDVDGWLVDAGGGGGGVTAMLGWRPERTVLVEGNAALAANARHRHGLLAARGDVDRVPVATGSASIVCLLDVIEHLADPVPALVEARRSLGPRGHLVVNVPAHRRLWSPADVALGHHRRYDRATLRRHLAAAGFEPVLLTHVFSWLVAPAWVKRRVTNVVSPELGLDQQGPVIDRAAMVLTWLERALVGRVPLPVGTSILCVAVPAAA